MSLFLATLLGLVTYAVSLITSAPFTVNLVGQLLVSLLVARWVANTIASLLGLSGGTLPPPSELSISARDALEVTLEGDHREFRVQLKEFLRSDAIFRLGADYYALSPEEQRVLTHERLRRMLNDSADGVAVVVKDVTHDPRKLIAAHEVTLAVDPSFTYAMSVHMNLFGGSLLKLGTAKHHKRYLQGVDNLSVPGCFALTEVGHGVLSGMHLDTTAHYDRTTNEFVINTPTVNARKNWISFATHTAKTVVVFAVLYTSGPDAAEEVNEGIHAFVVDFRDESTNDVIDGVVVEWMGHKPALNGNDNGRIWFNNLRVPRESLLDRYSQVADDGTFTSEIKDQRQRFLKVSDQLMTGRMCIASACLYSCRLSLLCAVRYAIAKEQTVKKGKQTQLFNHLSQRKPLLAAIAEVYALTFLQHETKEMYASLTHDEHVAKMDISEERKNEVLRAVCSLKSYAAQENVRITDMCRDKCGGQALVTENMLGQLSNVAVSLVVVEGDSCILAQKCVGELVKAALGNGSSVVKLARIAALSARVAVSNAVLLGIAFAGVDCSMHGKLLTLHYNTRLAALARRLLVSSVKGRQGLDWSTKYTSEILELHKVYAEMNAYNAISDKVEAMQSGEEKSFVTYWRDFFGLAVICRRLDFYLESVDAVTPSIAASLRHAFDGAAIKCSHEVALTAVAAFSIDTTTLNLPMAKLCAETKDTAEARRLCECTPAADFLAGLSR